ncbi:MAG: ATP-dependent DNA helicase RecG [Bacteroidaceae bacterium]|nr:ATP-dependent DNA helicase RecG [Bacteroidaceae bacterium]
MRCRSPWGRCLLAGRQPREHQSHNSRRPENSQSTPVVKDLRLIDIQYLAGVGPSRAAVLSKELNINTLHDLLYYFPYKHIDRSRLYYISEIDGNMPYIQLKGRILSYETVGTGRKMRLVGHFSDGTGLIDLVWFQYGAYIQKRYKLNTDYIVFGKPTVFNGRINLAHPDIESAEDLTLSEMGLRPYYNTTERMKRMNLTSSAMQKLVTTLFASLKEPIPETLPAYFIEQNHLISLDKALHDIHFPKNPEQLRQAEFRLKFEELFYIQLNILRYAHARQLRSKGLRFPIVGQLFHDFYAQKLPFPLTNAQKRVIREMRDDMNSGRQMNRLLQGDVGSGKTLVAMLTMLIAISNGYQACIMAPTEILAEQHFATISSMLEGLPVNVALLTGSIKGKKREPILSGLHDGNVNLLIATHAVLEDTVSFHALGLVVVDEQHRFGVAQRAKLWSKNDFLPHVLVMTATPIPRTLAMTLYGDLDVSVIDELPPGRRPVVTEHRYDKEKASLYQFIRTQINEGRQAYIVYPLIKESEKMDLKNLEEGYKIITEVFPEFNISMVHGQMKPADKEREMQRFVTGETQIMVATTVIEVGVNVPNASVMIIENAERFGLSQLHQLRGRVGRGASQSYCILVTSFKLTDESRKRIEIMTRTNDGFEIAEADMKLRGPGDLEGTQQSGIAFDLHIANLARDGQLLQHVRQLAEKILNDDPDESRPENAILWQQLRLLKKENVNWSAIS